MPGTPLGGKRAAKTNKLRYGKSFYAEIGARGGANGTLKGFASTKVGKDGLTGAQRAKKYGALGGKVSKRGREGCSIIDEKSNEVIALLKQGESYIGISRTLELPYHSLRHWVKKNALEYKASSEKISWKK